MVKSGERYGYRGVPPISRHTSRLNGAGSLCSGVIYLLLCVLTALLVYPILFLVFCPILVYRQIVQILVKCRNPNCGSILSGLDAILAGRDPYDNIPMILAPYMIFTAKLDRSHIVNVLRENVIKPNYYPNLKQRLVQRYGYHFWQDVEKFDVEHHVVYLDPENPEEPVNARDLQRLGCEKMGRLPFDRSRSPWELVLVPNVVDENNPTVKSALYVRVNHCLMDGYSVVYFIQKTAETPWITGAGQTNSQRKKCDIWRVLKRLGLLLQTVLTGPYYALKLTLFTDDTTIFLKKTLENVWKDQDYWMFSETELKKIDATRLKRVRTQHKAGVSSLLMTLAAESISRFIKSKCDDDGFSDRPKGFYVSMSFPLPGHPDTLTNHWTAVRMHIPIRKENDPRKMLKIIHQKYENLKHSPIPFVNNIILKLAGLCPISLYPTDAQLPSQTAILVNFPGPAKNCDMFGYPMETFNVIGNGMGMTDDMSVRRNEDKAFVVAIHSMNGKFWVDVVCVDTLCETPQEALRLQNMVHEVLTELELLEEPEINLGPSRM